MNSLYLKRKISNCRYNKSELQKILDIGNSTLWNITNGKQFPNVCLALRLCKLINADPYEIWGDCTENKPIKKG